MEQWFGRRPEILVLIQYSHAAGKKDFEFFFSLHSLSDRMSELPPLTCVTAFNRPQLPLRGLVDDSFIASCMNGIPEGSEHLVVETIKRVSGKQSWFHHMAGESHAELREALEGSRGVPVAVGLHPPQLDDGDEVIFAVVPDDHGAARAGVY